MASRTRDSTYKNGSFLGEILDERTAGLLLDADTNSLGSDMMTLGVRDRDPNDEIPIPSPTANNSNKGRATSKFGLVI